MAHLKATAAAGVVDVDAVVEQVVGDHLVGALVRLLGVAARPPLHSARWPRSETITTSVFR
jgi:hypothetical protein